MQACNDSAPTPGSNTSDYNKDGVPDLYRIMRTATNSGKTEVQIMNGAANFNYFGGWVTYAGNCLGSNNTADTIGDYNQDGIPDIYRINHWNTPSGRIEVQILNGSGFNYFGGWVTAAGMHGDDDTI